MVRYGRFWILLAMVFGQIGCEDSPTTTESAEEELAVLMVAPDDGVEPEIIECLTDGDCGVGMACASGSCVDGSAGLAGDCNADAMCADGMVCQDGACVAAEPGLEACGPNVQCADGAPCVDGTCAPTTDAIESADSMGGAEGNLVDGACRVDGDCEMGHLCRDGLCQAAPGACLRDSDCPGGRMCISGACQRAQDGGVTPSANENLDAHDADERHGTAAEPGSQPAERSADNGLCENTCLGRGTGLPYEEYQRDGECQDGGLGSTYSICALGTDCADCGPRAEDSPSSVAGGQDGVARATSGLTDASVCSDSCEYANDGTCDDGGSDSSYGLCDFGTDCGDCGPRTAAADERNNGGEDQTANQPSNSGSCVSACVGRATGARYPEYDNDGECQDGGEGSTFNICALGTDCGDCGPRADVGIQTPDTTQNTHTPSLDASSSAPDDGSVCNSTCVGRATGTAYPEYDNDGECQDGGPGSTYSICALGSDCGDCGPR